MSDLAFVSISSSSTQVTWRQPEVLNGVILYYSIRVVSIQGTVVLQRTLQAQDPLSVDVTGLSKQIPVGKQLSAYIVVFACSTLNQVHSYSGC